MKDVTVVCVEAGPGGRGGGEGDENNFSVSLHNSKNPRVKSKSHCEYDLSFELVM